MTRASITLSLLLMASPASAQDAATLTGVEALLSATDALSEGAPGRAFELARLARAFDPALSVEAYTLMGRAQSELGNAAAAHRFFRRALEHAEPAERGRLLARMQLERDEFGVVVVDVQPGGAELFVDGEPAELEQGERVLILRPGTREIVARLPGHEGRRASVHVSPGSHRVLHIVVPEGAEEVGDVPQPSQRHPGQRWLTGNLIMVGLGTLGMSAASGGLVDANPRVVDELHFDVGLGLGLVLGASANMLLSAELGEHGYGLFMIRFAAIPLLVGVALPFALWGWGLNQRCPLESETECVADQDAANQNATVAGTLLGMAVSTFSNLGLSTRDFPIAASLAATSFGLALLEGGLALSSFDVASALRSDAAEMQGREAIEAYEAAAAHESMGHVAGAVGLVLLGLTAVSATVAILGDSNELDLTVSAGPGTMSVRGVF